jgi:hypothetical protein
VFWSWRSRTEWKDKDLGELLRERWGKQSRRIKADQGEEEEEASGTMEWSKRGAETGMGFGRTAAEERAEREVRKNGAVVEAGFRWSSVSNL